VMASPLTRLTFPLSSRMSGTLRASASGVRSSWFAFTSAISSLRCAPCDWIIMKIKLTTRDLVSTR